MPQRGLESWLKKLTKKNMPVVGSVIAELNRLTGHSDTDLNQLAEVILRDPTLTSHVLRVSNSVHYNYSGYPINTVSRAIVVIGLKGMRAICISALLIDTLLRKSPNDRLLRLMAQALTAASQARDLITLSDESSGEEVFIAALLFHLGEMAFLAVEDLDQANPELFSEDPAVRRDAMERELGTSFKAITRGLAHHWKLGETLEQALYPGSTPTDKVRAVVLAERMSRAAQRGWQSQAVRTVLEEMKAYTGLESPACLALVQEATERAADIAEYYGAPQVVRLIPGKGDRDVAPVVEERVQRKVLRADPQLQLDILRELSVAASEQADVNTLFQIVIEGMHRGIGLERVTIAFIKHHRARAKYVLGEGVEHWRREFDFDVDLRNNNLLTHAINAGETVWVDQSFIDEHPHLYSEKLVEVIGQHPALIHAVHLGSRTPALFYADRGGCGGRVGREQYDSFCHFAAQAQFSLNMLSRRIRAK